MYIGYSAAVSFIDDRPIKVQSIDQSKLQFFNASIQKPTQTCQRTYQTFQLSSVQPTAGAVLNARAHGGLIFQTGEKNESLPEIMVAVIRDNHNMLCLG